MFIDRNDCPCADAGGRSEASGLQLLRYNSKTLIDAEKAFWVIGGNKMGVMTKRAKWAFGKKEDAEKFKAENGGDLTSFEQTVKAAYEDMYADTQMIRERRKMSKMEHKHDY
ncbi:MAG TPA: nitrous oxide reductase accessory protein NosL [Thermodesulfobacteriota bacterium]|nr:nitrous oxide reductase accessory protein NosL [Thermodesulfobacteriota bacterium]